MPEPAGVRFFAPPLDIPDLTFATLPNMTGQEVFEAGRAAEFTALVRRTVSVAAPVLCWSQAFTYQVPTTTPAFRILMVAIADGADAPSHFRINAAQGYALDWAGRWTQATGQAMDGTTTYDVFWWSPVVTTYPSTTVFEWPA